MVIAGCKTRPMNRAIRDRGLILWRLRILRAFLKTALLGMELDLECTVVPDNATVQTVVWTLGQGSTAEGAKVSDGKASALGTGKVSVRATVAKGGKNGKDYTKSPMRWTLTAAAPYTKW